MIMDKEIYQLMGEREREKEFILFYFLYINIYTTFFLLQFLSLFVFIHIEKNLMNKTK